MSKQFYVSTNFRSDALDLISLMNGVVDEYVQQGYRLTVRQLYYQLVARAVVENTERSYKRITGLVNDAKLAGLMDWDAIEDRTRAFIRRPRWEGASDILRASAQSFHMDMWVGQKKRVFVIVEKEALAGVLERACRAFDAPLLAARGYPSGTVLREFAQSDLIPCVLAKQQPVILHLGDHDPSGIDMTRDLAERFWMFITGKSGKALGDDMLQRIALTMDQIDEQKPPANPAKTTDVRFASYARKYGDESWELDALKPEYLDALVRQHIKEHVQMPVWNKRVKYVEGIRQAIEKVADDFDSNNK